MSIITYFKEASKKHNVKTDYVAVVTDGSYYVFMSCMKDWGDLPIQYSGTREKEHYFVSSFCVKWGEDPYQNFNYSVIHGSEEITRNPIDPEYPGPFLRYIIDCCTSRTFNYRETYSIFYEGVTILTISNSSMGTYGSISAKIGKVYICVKPCDELMELFQSLREAYNDEDFIYSICNRGITKKSARK